MAGDASSPIFLKEGMYLSLLCDEAVTLGQLVKLTTTGADTCGIADAPTDSVIGVAVGGDRFSRTATDNQVAAGAKVTVATKGIVYLTSDTSAILRGSYVEAAANGTVALAGTAGTATNVQHVLGQALDANGGAATSIRVRLFRG